MIKVYCEHGALSAELRTLCAEGKIKLVHWPYDSDSSYGLRTLATSPASPTWDEMNLSWDDLRKTGLTWADLKRKGPVDAILSVIGAGNVRDAKHLAAAYHSGCVCFVTVDSDILNHREELEGILGFRIFHGRNQVRELLDFLCPLTKNARSSTG